MLWWRPSSIPPQGDAHSSAGADAKRETFVPSPSCVTKDQQAKIDCETFSFAANSLSFLDSPPSLQVTSQQRGCIPPIARQQKCKETEKQPVPATAW